MITKVRAIYIYIVFAGNVAVAFAILFLHMFSLDGTGYTQKQLYVLSDFYSSA